MDNMDELGAVADASIDDGLRIISFNIQHGTPAEGWTTERGRTSRRGFRPDTAEAAAALNRAIVQLRQLDPDIVLLQEVDKGQVRSGKTNQAEDIARGLGMRHWRFGASFAGQTSGFRYRPLARTLPFERGYGLAICSRFPLIDARTTTFPRTPPAEKRAVAHLFRTRRVLMTCVVLTPWGHLALGNTHLETNRRVAGEQAFFAWTRLTGLRANSQILAGDFNLSPEETAVALSRELPAREMPDVATSVLGYPAHAPAHRIDQLLADGWRLAREPSGVRLAISDHCAAVFDLVPAPSPSVPVDEGLY